MSGPREIVDQAYTASTPSTPTGVRFSGRYHAAGDPAGEPPYMRRMVTQLPSGMRFDTSVPDRCTAPDIVLAVRGPAACPPGSRIGGGTTDGVFFAPVTHSFVLDRYTHTVDVMNNANEQIVLIKAEGYAVVRGRVNPDGSLEFNSPTCFPEPPVAGCLDDYVLQTKTDTFLPPYARTVGGVVRSYATTPQECPADGLWKTTMSFWWSDGTTDTVVSPHPCEPAPPA